MGKKILVGYATRYGSTAETASFIGKILEKSGNLVDIRPIMDVNDPGSYDVIILGSPLYMGKWLVEARDFVHRYRHALQERPLYVFSCGYSLREQSDVSLKSGEAALEAVRMYVNPADAAFFPGKVSLETLNPQDRAIATIGGTISGDYRNWEMVRAWAEKIRDHIR
jgi:menaquinone-dependent protoporphyrinogen oxidase